MTDSRDSWPDAVSSSDRTVTCTIHSYPLTDQTVSDAAFQEFENTFRKLMKAVQEFSRPFQAAEVPTTVSRPTSIDRRAWRAEQPGPRLPPIPATRPATRFTPRGRMKAREQIARGLV